jgi:hypothetical protein
MARNFPKRVALRKTSCTQIVIAAATRELFLLPARDPVMRFAKGPH